MMLERFADSCPNQTCGIIIAGAGPLALGNYRFHPLELEANVFVEQVDAGMPFAELGNGLTG